MPRGKYVKCTIYNIHNDIYLYNNIREKATPFNFVVIGHWRTKTAKLIEGGEGEQQDLRGSKSGPKDI
jgi:hypothetical protein